MNILAIILHKGDVVKFKMLFCDKFLWLNLKSRHVKVFKVQVIILMAIILTSGA